MENQNPVSAVRVSRRSLMKAGVAASAAKIAGIPITVIAANEAAAAEQGIKWTKGVCRFCGTGCGLLVGTKNGKIVATKGDPDCEVNRGLTCMKGYYNSEIIYGKDRLTQPLMRRTNGKFDKNGKFEPVSWKEAFDELEKHWRKAYQELGPTGVGKTALAKALAESWFGSEKALLKFDMSEYQEQHTVARLLGAPPGYLGHDEGGQLTEAVRRRPYSVVLFDEIEKAHPDIQNVLLQMLEDGQLTDSMGRKADFRNTIVLLTSNLGARFLAGQSAPLGFGAGSEAAFEKQSEAAVAEAKKWFRPELVGRLDELIVFRPLEEQSLCSIAEKLLGQLEERAARSGYQLTHTARVGPALAAKAHSPYGARELRRQVDRAVEQAFADQIASGSVSLGQHWTADCTEDGTIVVQETQTAGVG